jgi:hypothetical protein
MNTEQSFAQKICQALDQGTYTLDASITERLRAARERALARQHVLVSETQIVGADGTAMLHGHEEERHPLRMLFAILALLLGFSLAYHWNGFSLADENEAIDSALLADDLPPNAYLDRGFQAWIDKDTSPAR